MSSAPTRTRSRWRPSSAGSRATTQVVRYDEPRFDTLLNTLLGIESQLGSLNAAGKLSGQGGGVSIPK